VGIFICISVFVTEMDDLETSSLGVPRFWGGRSANGAWQRSDQELLTAGRDGDNSGVGEMEMIFGEFS
jgi:hypothetical protein